MTVAVKTLKDVGNVKEVVHQYRVCLLSTDAVRTGTGKRNRNLEWPTPRPYRPVLWRIHLGISSLRRIAVHVQW